DSPALNAAASSAAFMRVPRPRASTTAFIDGCPRHRGPEDSCAVPTPGFDLGTMRRIVLVHHRGEIAQRYLPHTLLASRTRPFRIAELRKDLEVEATGGPEGVDGGRKRLGTVLPLFRDSR